MFSQKCHFIFPRFSCGKFCKLCNFRFCGFVVTKAWKLHFYLWCWGIIVNFAKSSFTNHAEEWFVVQLQQLVRKNWRNCALNQAAVMLCLLRNALFGGLGYRCAPPQRLVLLSLLRSRVRARGVAQFAAAWHGLAVNWREEDQQLRVASSKSYKKTWF